MCGIVGYINKQKQKEFTATVIRSMVNMQNHRGPDDNGICAIGENEFIVCDQEGTYDISKGVNGFFGFSRLSILDLSEAGHQPMISEDQNVMLVFNGEVYNAFEYKKELIDKGYTFRSNTDTEVILNLYMEYGAQDAICKLNGMFAIAIYDFKENKLFLARDRFGIKPLYVYEDEQVLGFASEIKSFLKTEKFKIALDENAYRENFVFGNTLSKTMIKNVESVQPGTILELNSDGTIVRSKYFSLEEYTRPDKVDGSFLDIIEKTEEILKSAIKRQMISDVKLGCQLSGGIDSSTISYYAAQLECNNLNDSIAIIFEKKYEKYTEEKYIDYVSQKLSLDLHKCVLDEKFYVDNLQKAIWHLDTIPAYYNELGILLLSQEAKKYVTVLLSGEGADELLAGYTRMAYSGLIAKICKFNIFLPKKIKMKICKGRSCSFEHYAVFKEAIPLSVCKRIFKTYDDSVALERIHKFQEAKGSNFDKQIKYEMNVRMQGLLNRQDKMTMANSIENRVPLLDNEMVEWGFGIPRKYLIHVRLKDFFKTKGKIRIQGKYVLKELCKKNFGEEFAYRDKMGFDIPCREYLSNQRVKEYYKEVLLNSIKKRGLINYRVVEYWYSNLETITIDELNALWRCICLEIWLLQFIDGDVLKK